MTDTSIGIIRSIVREMVLSEAVRPPTAQELAALEPDQVGAAREFSVNASNFFTARAVASTRSDEARIQKILAGSSAADMVIARIAIDRSDFDRLKVEDKLEPSRSIDLAARLRKIKYYRKIARAEGSKIIILSSGEIEKVAIEDAQEMGAPDRQMESRLYLEMMGSKISVVNAILNVIKEFILILTENTLVEAEKSDLKEKGGELTDADRRRLKAEATAMTAGRSFAATSAVDSLTSILAQANNYLIALDAHAGVITDETGGELDVSDMSRERLQKRLGDEWGGNAIGTYMRVSQAQTGPFTTPQNREMVGRGTAVDVSGISRGDTAELESIVTMFNRLLGMQGLSMSRATVGKGITGGDERKGTIDRNVRDPAMIAQAIEAKRLFDAAQASVEGAVGDRSVVRISPERLKKMAKKSAEDRAKRYRQIAAEISSEGETTVTLTGGKKVKIVAPGSKADLRRQKLLKVTSGEAEQEIQRREAESQARAAELGFTALGGEAREESVTPAITEYLELSLRGAALNIAGIGGGAESARIDAQASRRARQYVKAAYNAFIRPIAKALTEGRFCDLKELADLTDITPSNVYAASQARKHASRLMVEPMDTRDRSMGAYDQLLQRAAGGREEDLLALFSPQPGVNLLVNPAEVAKALRQMRADSFSGGQRQLFGNKISGLGDALADVVREAMRSAPAQMPQIKAVFKELNMEKLIEDIEEDDLSTDLFSYIVGTPLEPIRASDIDEVRQQAVSIKAGLNTPAARAAEPGSEEEAEAAAAGARNIARQRALSAANKREREITARMGKPAYETEPTEIDEPGIGAGEAAGEDFGDLDERRLFEALKRALIQRASAQKAAGR